MLSAGEKTELLTIQRDTRTYTKGVESVVSADIGTAWAKVEPLTGGEYFRAQQVASKITWRVRVDYRTDLLQRDRFSWSGKTLEIVGVMPDRAKWETVCMCEERA